MFKNYIIMFFLIIGFTINSISAINWGKYGLSASNNGVANSIAINKAIKNESMGGSCIIDLPKGVIKLAKSIKVGAGMIFKGHGASFNKGGTVLQMVKPVPAFIASGAADKFVIRDLVINYLNKCSSDSNSIGILIKSQKNQNNFPSEFIISNIDIHKPYIGIFDTTPSWGSIYSRIKVQQFYNTAFYKNHGTTITMTNCVANSGYNNTTAFSFFGITNLSMINCAADGGDMILNMSMVRYFNINGFDAEYNKPNNVVIDINTCFGSISGLNLVNTRYYNDTGGSLMYIHGTCEIDIKHSCFGGTVYGDGDYYTIKSNLATNSVINTKFVEIKKMQNKGNGFTYAYKNFNNFNNFCNKNPILDSIMQNLNELQKKIDSLSGKNQIIDKKITVLNTLIVTPKIYQRLDGNKIKINKTATILIYNFSGQLVATIEQTIGIVEFKMPVGVYILDVYFKTEQLNFVYIQK